MEAPQSLGFDDRGDGWGGTRRKTGPTNTLYMLADEFDEIHGYWPKSVPPPGPHMDKLLSDPTVPKSDEERDNAIRDILDRLQGLYREFHQIGYPRSAVCLSGGGIRSAAFALGLLQYLARVGLLEKFHYLSTVSGGGYIGSWLSAWIVREGAYRHIRDRLGRRQMPDDEAVSIKRIRENSNFLTPKIGALSADTWAALAILIRNLLLNWLILVPLIGAAVLTPKIAASVIGPIASWSGWRAAAALAAALGLYVAALIGLNGRRPRWEAFDASQGRFLWFVLLLPALPAALIGAAFLRSAWPLDGWIENPWGLVGISAFAGAIVYVIALVAAAAWAWRTCPPYVILSRFGRSKDGNHLVYELCLFGKAMKATEDASVGVFTEDRQALAGKDYEPLNARVVFRNGERRIELKVALCDPRESNIDATRIEPRDVFIKFRDPNNLRIGYTPKIAWELPAYAAAGALFGLLTALGGLLYSAIAVTYLTSGKIDPATALVAFGPPWLLVSHAIAHALFAGLTSRLLRSDEEREWLGRSDGWFLIAALAWALLAAVVLLLPVVLPTKWAQTLRKKGGAALLAAVGGTSGLVTALVGGGAKTPALDNSQGSRLRTWVLYGAALLFLVSLALGISQAVDWLAFGPWFPDASRSASGRWWKLLVIACVLAVLSLLVGFFINVNRFSLHELYRNRLVRAFLGASNTGDENRQNKFTLFNFTDDLLMCRLWRRRPKNREAEKPDLPENIPPERREELERECRRNLKRKREKELTGDNWRPFHVVNMALNIVSSKNLATQERKAESFTVSPLWCGADYLKAYRRASEYGGLREPISLGTAMAISGAAVSPNMGYNSSPLITFLLTLFNIRLGWWFGNPLYRRFPDEGPKVAAGPLLVELFGHTNEDRDYIYLSDGGHFDNLGLYEMVRRRCHLIIVSDAGQDPDIGLADLSNATRKIAIDLGVKIDFPRLNCLRERNKLRAKPEEGGPCYTVGRIRYRDAERKDGNGKTPDDVKDGILLYVKPGFRGDEPADILGYAAGNKDFPHETTVDQWFSESQFESYRALGFTIMRRIHGAAVGRYNRDRVKDDHIDDFASLDLRAFFEAIEMSEGEQAPSPRQAR